MTLIKILQRLFSPLKDDPVGFIQNIFEATCVGVYTIFSIEIMRSILISIEAKDISSVYNSLMIYLSVTIIAIALRFTIRHWGWSRISFDGVSRESEKYLQKFIQADGNQVEKIGTGRFISILDKGLYQWMDVLFDLTFRGTFNAIMVGYAIYTIAKINTWGGVSALLLMILSSIVATYANIWMTEKRKLRRIEQNEANHQVVIALMSKNELLQNNGFPKILGKIRHHLYLAKKAQEIVNIGFLVIEEFPRFMFLLLRAGVYLLIALEIFSVNGGIIELGIFVTIMAIAEKSLNEFLHLLRDILREFSSISLLWSTFDSLTPIKGYDSGTSFSPKQKNIEIKNISYGYNETKVFDDFSLTIEKGKKTALVGASGGGKTTLMKLIAGYLHPESGSISIMGNQLHETALKTYYPHIGYLTQDPGVFDATIRENLVSVISSIPVMSTESSDPATTRHPARKTQKTEQDFSLRSASFEMTEAQKSEKKLIEALRLAQCDFVFELEKGLDTEIGERGVRLSGGQKQRLAIAKIFLKNPEIVLLDEPTSALDSFSEEKITEALDTLFENRTVIIIAHRLQTVKRADDIIVIEGGEIVERGDHLSLLEDKGIYHKMLELQSGF